MADEQATLEEVALDVQRAMQRVAKHNTTMDIRAELGNNVYPLMLVLLDAVNSRCLETEETVAQIINETETIIQPEEGDQIDETLDLGEKLYNALKMIELPDTIKALAESFNNSLIKTRDLLADLVIDNDEGDDTDEDEEDDTDESEGE